MASMFSITQEPVDHTLYVLLEGRLDGSNSGPASEQLQEALKTAGASRLVLDLSGLEYISSAGLRVILVAAKQAKAQGAELCLCSPTREVKEVLDISGFGSIMKIVSCREDV